MSAPPSQATDDAESSPQNSGIPSRLGILIVLLYVFLVAIRLLSDGIQRMGAGTAEGLFDGISHPLAALAVGILATVLVQSSSITTSTIVALVGAGTIGVVSAVPMIMGANIGTTVTSTLVSLGSVGRKAHFRRAFAAATVHDIFNLLAVAVFLPLQLATGFLSDAAEGITGFLGQLGVIGSGGSFQSPIHTAIEWATSFFDSVVSDALGLSGVSASVAVLALGLGLLFFSLSAITKTMRVVIAEKAELSLNAALQRTGLIAIALGTGITMLVQSSSITTSLLIPLCAGGLLSLENAFPVVIGANIGTTVTAFIASLATGEAGLEIALVHVLFNLAAAVMLYSIPRVRQIPIGLSRQLAVQAARNKLWAVLYLAVTFVAFPLGLIYALE